MSFSKKVFILIVIGISSLAFGASKEDVQTEAIGVTPPCEHCGPTVTGVQRNDRTNCDNPLLPESKCSTTSKESLDDKKDTRGIR